MHLCSSVVINLCLTVEKQPVTCSDACSYHVLNRNWFWRHKY